MGWSGPLKKPTMAVRWGIAIEYNVQRGYKGSAYPVGTTQTLATKAGTGGGATGGQPQPGFGGPGDGGLASGGMGGPQAALCCSN